MICPSEAWQQPDLLTEEGKLDNVSSEVEIELNNQTK